jgi:hypothetical protein
LNLLSWHLEWIGGIFPLAYSLDGIGLCLQRGQSLASTVIVSDTISLLTFTIIAMPIVLCVSIIGYDAARKDTSLGQY